MSALELTDMQEEIASVIRDFSWSNFGMDDIDIRLEEDPESQEWVPYLALEIDRRYKDAQ